MGAAELFRVRAAQRACGRVLDIGEHHREDLPAYRDVCYLALVGTAPHARETDFPMPVSIIEAADRLPFPDNTFDVVVSRFGLCRTGIGAVEIARVLRPTGHLLFLEYVQAGVGVRLHRAGLVMRRIDRFDSSTLVLGVATHPEPQYARELNWLRGAAMKE